MGWTVVAVGRCPFSLETQLVSFAHANAGGGLAGVSSRSLQRSSLRLQAVQRKKL